MTINDSVALESARDQQLHEYLDGTREELAYNEATDHVSSRMADILDEMRFLLNETAELYGFSKATILEEMVLPEVENIL